MLKTYVIVLFVGFSFSCAHRSAGDQPTSVPSGQDRNRTDDCAPTSDIENDSQKQGSFSQVRARCASEIEKFCKDVECPKLMKPTQVCLMMVDKEIGKDCKKEINRHIDEYQPYIKVLED